MEDRVPKKVLRGGGGRVEIFRVPQGIQLRVQKSFSFETSRDGMSDLWDLGFGVAGLSRSCECKGGVAFQDKGWGSGCLSGKV